MNYEKVKEYIRRQDMLNEWDLVLAGVSGGADSMAMLDMLRRYQAECSFSLKVVHVNHGIRGEEAFRDQKHVEEYCRLWAIPIQVFRFDVPEYASLHGLGMEEAGRILRDQAFAQAAKEETAADRRIRIALAHNQNDQAETVLHNLARGSGLRGLSGIRPVAEDKIRPLLCLSRQEIEHYLEEQKLAYQTDSSNQETHYTRNRIRHHILPLMQQELNEQTVSHLANTAEQTALAEEYLTGQGTRLFRKFQTGGEEVFFDRSFFLQEQILKQYAVREALYGLGGARKDITTEHIRSVLRLEELPVSKRVSLPYGLTAFRGYEGICICKEPVNVPQKKRVSENSRQPYELIIPGQLKCDYGTFLTRIFFRNDEKIEEKLYTKWLDYDKIQGNLSVRTRNTGDFLVIDGQGNHKKLNRCMIDDKVPSVERDDIPLVVSGNEVLWIVGGRISEKYKIMSGTKQVLEITYKGGKPE